MAARVRSILVGLAAALVLGACGAPDADVSAVQARLMADKDWSCPQDHELLQAVQTAHEHLEGRSAVSVDELERSGLLVEDAGLAATFEDGEIVSLASDRCAVETYGFLDFERRCLQELDGLTIDVYIGLRVARHLGSSLSALEQARAVGVDHGPYVAYTWDDDEQTIEVIDHTCPDEEEITAAIREGTASAGDEVCIIERRTLETATEAYWALTDGPPADEQTLVDEGLLRQQVEGFDLAPDGSVVPAPGGRCA